MKHGQRTAADIQVGDRVIFYRPMLIDGNRFGFLLGVVERVETIADGFVDALYHVRWPGFGLRNAIPYARPQIDLAKEWGL